MQENTRMMAAADTLERVAGALRQQDKDGMTPLRLYAWLKRVQAVAEEAMAEVKQGANDEFAEMMAKTPSSTKAWPIGDFALVSVYGAPGTWIYPKELIRMESELKDAKETAKQSGAAKRIDPPVDPKATAFKIQLLKV